jgi:hypothetical protein
VEFKIEPEPTPTERDAIMRALSEDGLGGAATFAYRSAWREEGIRENTRDSGPDELADPGA